MPDSTPREKNEGQPRLPLNTYCEQYKGDAATPNKVPPAGLEPAITRGRVRAPQQTRTINTRAGPRSANLERSNRESTHVTPCTRENRACRRRGVIACRPAPLSPHCLCSSGCRLHILRVRNMRARERASERVHHHTALHPTLSVTSRHLVGVLLGLRKHLTDTLTE